jgi:hypothetical protein
MLTTEALTFAAGDLVELAEPVAHCRGIAVGQRGVVLVDGLPWGMVTVSFTEPRPDLDGRCYMIRAQHLRKVQP